jgi:cellobiose phosphorylase
MKNQPDSNSCWKFIDGQGNFELHNPQDNSYLYFPLLNEAGLVSSISPNLNGDIKIGQNAFLTIPVSVEDLHSNRSGRNFWVNIDGFGPWSVAGNSAEQTMQRLDPANRESITLQAGFLWHKVQRSHRDCGLEAEVTNFVPTGDDQVELMRVVLRNHGNVSLAMQPTAAIPIFGRSADNLRDHRHVTSLLQRIRCSEYGVSVCPTLSFDERGHVANRVIYHVLGCESNGDAPVGFFPVVEDYIGEGGSLDWPAAIVNSQTPSVYNGAEIDGYEALGGLRFKSITLQPGEERIYILILAVQEEPGNPGMLIDRYGSGDCFDDWLGKTEIYWDEKLEPLHFHTGDERFSTWMKWVCLQPVLRRMIGNSFLPYHDYGRGGRGWRDLWQDILGLLLMESEGATDPGIDETLLGNFAGVRIDGSNANIIGTLPGEFKADRNDIPRVWMDHGAWPLLTTRLYIERTGDLPFLLREQTYFKDRLSSRAQTIDTHWDSEQGTQLLTAVGGVYSGTVLEHLIVQNVVQFFNVGEHNIIRLEGADWNDGMDMASQRGECVAFSALYAGNLYQLAGLARELCSLGNSEVELAEELMLLLDNLMDPVDYDSVEAKTGRLEAYFGRCCHTLSGRKVTLKLEDVADDLERKAAWLSEHIRREEWIRNREGYGWFNGYYDNDGNQLEGDHPLGPRMTLTGQVFTLMEGVATADQAQEIILSADRYLFDPMVGGYRLNTNFGEVLLNMGRCFGYAFGHKENGAMFTHMAMMYANALYKRGYAKEGHRVLAGIYKQSVDFQTSRMYPGIPEYFNNRGRGMYPYLTGSASWFLLTLVAEVFGVQAELGDLVLAPRLVLDQFDQEGVASITTVFAGKKLKISYHNPRRLEYGSYHIGSLEIDGGEAPFDLKIGQCRIPREALLKQTCTDIQIDVYLTNAFEGKE